MAFFKDLLATASILVRANEASNGMGSYFISNRKEPPKSDTKKWLEMYNTNPRLNSVTKISLDIAATEGQVFELNGKTGKLEPKKNHPLLELLSKPVEEYNITGKASLYLSQVHFLIKGESFGIIERNSSGEPANIWFVPPNWVTPPNAEHPNEFEVQYPKNGATIWVNKKDMFYRKNPNPLDPAGRGLGRIEPLADEIETDEYMSKFAKRFFYNDATPNIVITAPPEAEEEEIKRAERKWYQKFGGFMNSSKAAFLNWEAKLHVLNTSNREMDFIESRKFYRDLTLQHFGIPPEIMGNVENSNKATVVAARDIYHNEVLDTMLVELEEAITQQLLPQFKNSKNLVFKFKRRQDVEDSFILDLAQKSYDDGALTLKEYRSILSNLLNYDLEELPNNYGDRISVPVNRVLIDINKPYEEQVKKPEESEGKTNEGGSTEDGE